MLTARDRREVQVPDRDVFTNIVYNMSDVRWRRNEVAFTVAYGEDLSKVRTLVTEAVTALDLVHDDPEPVAYIEQRGDEGVEFRMRYYHDDEDRIAAKDQVAELIVRTLDAADIKMAAPELIVYQRAAS